MYSGEFRASAVKLVLNEGQDVVDVAERLGVDLAALKRWVKKEQVKGKAQDQESMRELLLTTKRQEEEIRRLKMERDILKKAMAYLAPHQS